MTTKTTKNVWLLELVGAVLCAGVVYPAGSPVWRPSYAVNFSTSASSMMAGYSLPGLLSPFSVPGGDIFGLIVGPGGMVVPPMTDPRPTILCPAGPAGFGMGFQFLPACVEVDAYSTGEDWRGRPWPWVIIFSVDRTSRGFPWPRPMPAARYGDVTTEAAGNDAAADMYVSGVYLRVVRVNGVDRLQIGTPAWNYLGFDGDGISGGRPPAAAVTALGLFEPSPPGVNDDLDGIDGVGATQSFKFMQKKLMSPNYPTMPVLGKGSILEHGLFFSLDRASANAYGCSAADILATNDGDPPWVWASAQQLGLDPAGDDIDALAIHGGYARQGSRYDPQASLIMFSVTRTSAIVGTPDVLYGIPIMPSDILIPADILGFPGRIAILVPASGMGLLPMLQRPPGVVTDDLDALHGYGMPEFAPGGDTDFIEWDTFSLYEDPQIWLPPEAIQEWDEFPLPSASALPEGPFDPATFLGKTFRRGDANSGGEVDIGDAIFILNYLFRKGRAPTCEDAGDANDDGHFDLGDAIKILGYLFRSEAPLRAPFPACGVDPTADSLTCGSYAPCEP